MQTASTAPTRGPHLPVSHVGVPGGKAPLWRQEPIKLCVTAYGMSSGAVKCRDSVVRE